jgi:hypothetical protein
MSNSAPLTDYYTDRCAVIYDYDDDLTLVREVLT